MVGRHAAHLGRCRVLRRVPWLCARGGDRKHHVPLGEPMQSMMKIFWQNYDLNPPEGLAVGEERDLYMEAPYKYVLKLKPWYLSRRRVGFAPGHMLEVSIRQRDYVEVFGIKALGRKNVTIDSIKDAAIFRDLEWSYRVAGDNKNLTAIGSGRTATIVVPDLGDPLTKYKFF